MLVFCCKLDTSKLRRCYDGVIVLAMPVMPPTLASLAMSLVGLVVQMRRHPPQKCRRTCCSRSIQTTW